MNPTEWEKQIEAVFTKRDGAWTYSIERACIFGALVILMASAPVAALVPNSWLQVDLLAAIDNWARGVWPKLHHDAGVLDAASPMRGVRYSLFLLYCVGVMIIVLAVTVPASWRSIKISSERLTYPQSSALWKIPIALLVLIFWNVFETGFFGSKTSVSRGITAGWALWFWTALLWGAFSMTLGATMIVAAKIWTHGRPEGSYEYLQRMPREQRSNDVK